jgi:hypothetical protein
MDIKNIKNKLLKFLNSQFIVYFILFTFGLILTHNKYSPVRIIISLIFLNVFSHFIHVMVHIDSITSFFHLYFHHNHELNENIYFKTLSLFIETFVNIFGNFLIIYFIQKIIGIEYIPNIILFYYGFIYVTVHIINYSLFHATKTHVLHHESNDNDNKKICNYGPDIVDHILGTNCDDKFENMDHIIPNILMSYLITYYVYKPKLF